MTTANFFDDPDLQKAMGDGAYKELDYWAAEARTAYAEEDYAAATAAAIMFLAFTYQTKL